MPQKFHTPFTSRRAMGERKKGKGEEREKGKRLYTQVPNSRSPAPGGKYWYTIENIRPSSVTALGGTRGSGAPQVWKSPHPELVPPQALTCPHLALRRCRIPSPLRTRVCPSHAVLQGLDAIGLHNGLCFLCLHFHRLTEHQPCPGCPSWLDLLLEHN